MSSPAVAKTTNNPVIFLHPGKTTILIAREHNQIEKQEEPPPYNDNNNLF